MPYSFLSFVFRTLADCMIVLENVEVSEHNSCSCKKQVKDTYKSEWSVGAYVVEEKPATKRQYKLSEVATGLRHPIDGASYLSISQPENYR